MSEKTELKKKRGDIQLVALEIINKIPEDYVFEELTKEIGEAVWPGRPDMEAKTRHLIRYLVKYQDRKDVGKEVTLRDQGRIIQPSWYTPITPDKTVKEHACYILDGLKYVDFPLKKPNGRKTPVKKEKTVLATITGEKRGTPERLQMMKLAARNLQTRQATRRIEELAQAGAHRFASPTKTTTPETTPSPVLEDEEV